MKNGKHILWLLLGIYLFSVAQSPAQKVDVKVDGQRIYDAVDYMASHEFLGRKPNTPEFFKLQDWTVKKYQAWGLEPAGEEGTFYQSVPISREYAVTYGRPRLVINGREFYTRFEDFEVDTRSRGKKAKGDVVFVGHGISAPEKGFDEYAGIDVKGKILLILKGDPTDFEPPRSRMGSPSAQENTEDVLEDWTVESDDSVKIMTAYQKGAAGLLFYDPSPSEFNFMRRFRPIVKASPFDRDFIVLSELSEEIFKWILWTDPQMSSRGFTSWLNGVRSDIRLKKTRSFATKLKADITGYEKILLKGKSFNDNVGRNVMAKITGSDPDLRDEYVVMGAHFDHLGVTNGQVYNGAEDNASGSAVVMEVARLMKENDIQPKRTVIFGLWTAEELGLVGSRHWVKSPCDGVSIDNVVAYFNMDMVGLGDQINAPGALNFPSIWEVIKRDQDEDIIDVVKPRIGGPGGSDHSPFIELGIESLALMTGGEGGHPDYHDTGDDVEKLNREIMGKTAKFVLQGTVNLANETETDLLIENREDLYSGLYWPLKVINPDLKVSGSWKYVKAKKPKDLSYLLTKTINELKEPQDNSDPFAALRRRFRTTPLQNGLRGGKSFDYNIYLMETAKQLIEFGRIDFYGDDGTWFNEGLTDAGLTALKAMEKRGITVHLIGPSKNTFAAVLEKSKKPFMISGYSEFEDSAFAAINEKKVIIGVDFDPENVDETVKVLNNFKKKLGDTDNLILNVTKKEGLDKAKKELYLSLSKAGWSKKEIYPIGGVGTERGSQGNFDVLPGGRRRFPRF